MNIGILTAGGICPGVNNMLNSIVTYEKAKGNNVYGFTNGFNGLNKNEFIGLSNEQTDIRGPGSLLRLSNVNLEIDQAFDTLEINQIQRLYCLCGNRSMKRVADLALHDENKINIIGLGKSIYNDITDTDSIGFHTAIHEFTKNIEYGYIEAFTMNAIVFVEAPGLPENNIALQGAFAKHDIVTNIINEQLSNDKLEHAIQEIEYNYINSSFANVVVSAGCNYSGVVSVLKKTHDVRVIQTGISLRNVEPCTQDIILSNRMIKTAFDHAQLNKNFIAGTSDIITFENFIKKM